MVGLRHRRGGKRRGLHAADGISGAGVLVQLVDHGQLVGSTGFAGSRMKGGLAGDAAKLVGAKNL
jgi:hypothetical protein